MENQRSNIPNSLRAAAIYRHAITLKEEAILLASLHPKIAARIEEAVKLLVVEGRRAEAEASAVTK